MQKIKLHLSGINKKFDLIFIDGNYHYDYVKSDTEKVLQHLVHKYPVIVMPDYNFNPEKIRFEVIHAILDGMSKEFHPNIYHVANIQYAVFLRGDFRYNTLTDHKPEKIILKPFSSMI